MVVDGGRSSCRTLLEQFAGFLVSISDNHADVRDCKMVLVLRLEVAYPQSRATGSKPPSHS